MKKMKRLLTALGVLLLFLTTFNFTINSQVKPEVLTNIKIINLVRLKLSDEIIIEKISQSECKCDTSTEGLTQLKAAKVSDSIIMAMLSATSGGVSDSDSSNQQNSNKRENIQPNTNLSTENKALNQIREPGIYLFENGEMKQIEASVFSGGKINTLMSTLTYGVKKAKYKAKVRGASANMQTSNSKPEFYFVFNPEYRNSGAVMAGSLFLGLPATSPAEFVLVEMEQKNAARQAVLGEFGVWTGAEMGARDKDIREYSFEKITIGIYKVIPKENLEAGEYCFYYAGNTGIGFAGGKVFDFTITK